MVRSLLFFGRILRNVPFLEALGAALIVAGVWLLAELAWALIAAGFMVLLKAADLTLAQKPNG